MASGSTNQSTSLGTSQSQNAAQGSSASQSSSFIPNFSQTPILESIAQYAEGMAPQVYQWGMEQYGKNQGNIDDLMRTAETYGSGQRLAADMGMAESGVQMAGEHALENSKQDLESYGIDPSSGRYAALDQASKVQTAAAAAGAGNQQRQADIATGNAMKNQAISASLQNANFGLGVGANANNFLSTAIRLPYSPLGNASASASQNSSQGGSVSQNQSQSTGNSFTTDPAAAGGRGGAQSGGGQKTQPPSDGGGGAGRGQPSPTYGPQGISGGGTLGSGGGYGDPGIEGGDPSQGIDPGYGGDPFGGDQGWGDSNPTTTGGGDPYSDPGTWGGGVDNTYYDQPSGSDTSFSGEFYAEGGPVDDDQQGFDPDQGEDQQRFVSPTLSPSGGQQTDDVPAHLNAGEFVLPDDVVKWKGEEFFQKLISTSRQAREGIMAAHGQMQGQPPQGMNLGGAI
jgi:hypothetical protein